MYSPSLDSCLWYIAHPVRTFTIHTGYVHMQTLKQTQEPRRPIASTGERGRCAARESTGFFFGVVDLTEDWESETLRRPACSYISRKCMSQGPLRPRKLHSASRTRCSGRCGEPGGNIIFSLTISSFDGFLVRKLEAQTTSRQPRALLHSAAPRLKAQSTGVFAGSSPGRLSLVGPSRSPTSRRILLFILRSCTVLIITRIFLLPWRPI